MNELNIIKDRWRNRQNFFLQYEKEGALSVAAVDINYLLSRLEAAEKVAKDGVSIGRIDTLRYTIENLELFLEEMKKKMHIVKEASRNVK